MESNPRQPTAAEASAALSEAEASRSTLARGLTMPSWFFTSISAAIAVQIASSAVGLATQTPGILAAGMLVFAAVAAAQLFRFRRLNGVWIGGLASSVVLGSATAASSAYAVAAVGAIMAGYYAQWWLVALGSIVGGVAYGLSGRWWMRAYREAPGANPPDRTTAWWAALVVGAIAATGGLVLLLLKA